MKPIYRRLSIFVVALVVVAAGYFGYRLYVASQRAVPQEFSEARSQGALAAEKIVSSSNDIASSIAQFSSATTTPAQASSSIGEVLAKVAEVRSQAVELAAALGKMTQAVPQIRSTAAQKAALDSISERLELVEHLVTYTDEVTSLTKAIRSRISAGAKNSTQIAVLIKEINDEVTTVNKLSAAANRSMEEFDTLLR